MARYNKLFFTFLNNQKMKKKSLSEKDGISLADNEVAEKDAEIESISTIKNWTASSYSFDKVVFIDNEAGKKLFFHNSVGNKWIFTMSGYRLYKPNRCSSNGYGSDNLFVLCTVENRPALLEFENDAGYGTMWKFKYLNDDEYKNLCLSREAAVWYEASLKKAKKEYLYLVPDCIDDIRNLLPNELCTGKITEQMYAGTCNNFFVKKKDLLKEKRLM